MDADASWDEFADFFCCICRETLFSKRGATIFLRFHTSGPVLFTLVIFPDASFAFS